MNTCQYELLGVCKSTHSKRHHQVDHALLVIPLPATETEPLIHHASLPQALWDGDMCPRYSVIHGERPLDGTSEKKNKPKKHIKPTASKAEQTYSSDEWRNSTRT